MNHKEQSAHNRELGELHGVLEDAAALTSLQEEIRELDGLERDLDSEQEIRHMAGQERRALQEKVRQGGIGILMAEENSVVNTGGLRRGAGLEAVFVTMVGRFSYESLGFYGSAIIRCF